MMTGGPSAGPKSGMRGFCWLVPGDGDLEVAGVCPSRTFPASGSLLRLQGTTARFGLTMGWDERDETQVRLSSVEAWPGLGFPVGSYPGVVACEEGLLRKSGTIKEGASVDLKDGPKLKADLSWAARLSLAVPQEREPRLQPFGVAELPCHVTFQFARVTDWIDEEDNRGYGNAVPELPLGFDPARAFGFESLVTKVVVRFVSGWSESVPGFFVMRAD